MDETMTGLHRQTLHALTKLMSQWSSLDLQRRIAAACGVSLDHVGVRTVYVLGIAGGTLRPSDIADELHLTRPSTSKLVARLTTAGLIERSQDPADGRSVHIELTSEGQRTYEQLFTVGAQMLSTATSGWDPADVRTLSILLTRLTDGTTTASDHSFT